MWILYWKSIYFGGISYLWTLSLHPPPTIVKSWIRPCQWSFEPWMTDQSRERATLLVTAEGGCGRHAGVWPPGRRSPVAVRAGSPRCVVGLRPNHGPITAQIFLKFFWPPHIAPPNVVERWCPAALSFIDEFAKNKSLLSLSELFSLTNKIICKQ